MVEVYRVLVVHTKLSWRAHACAQVLDSKVEAPAQTCLTMHEPKRSSAHLEVPEGGFRHGPQLLQRMLVRWHAPCAAAIQGADHGAALLCQAVEDVVVGGLHVGQLLPRHHQVLLPAAALLTQVLRLLTRLWGGWGRRVSRHGFGKKGNLR